MAKVHLNLNELNLDGKDVGTFGNLILYLTGEALPKDEVIYRIVIDGEDVSEDRERAIKAEPLSDFEIVEIYTRKAVDIAIDGLKSACELVPSIHSDMRDAARSIRSSDFERGYNLISDLAPYLGWYIELLTAIETVFVRSGNDFMLRSGDNGGIHSFANIEAVREQVVALAQAQEFGDHAAVADIIEYELVPLIGAWGAEAPLLLNRMKECRSAA